MKKMPVSSPEPKMTSRMALQPDCPTSGSRMKSGGSSRVRVERHALQKDPIR